MQSKSSSKLVSCSPGSKVAFVCRHWCGGSSRGGFGRSRLSQTVAGRRTGREGLMNRVRRWFVNVQTREVRFVWPEQA